jgi:nicotinamidase-related amidase
MRMPIDIRHLVKPETTAVLVLEMQNGLAGVEAGDTPIAKAVAEQGTVARGAEVLAAARAAGVRVVHCTKLERADGLGATVNTPMWRRRARVGFTPLVPGSREAAIISELGPEDSDIICARTRGLTVFGGTELDAILHNLHVETVVLVGISLNVGVFAAAADAVSCGYEVVVARDAVAGAPKAFAEDLLNLCIAPIATLTEGADLIAVWQQSGN